MKEEEVEEKETRVNYKSQLKESDPLNDAYRKLTHKNIKLIESGNKHKIERIRIEDINV